MNTFQLRNSYTFEILIDSKGIYLSIYIYIYIYL